MSERTDFDEGAADGVPPDPTIGEVPTAPSVPGPSAPAGAPPAPTAWQPPTVGSPLPPGPTPRDSMAVASLVCALVGVLVGLGAILGIVFGFVARSRIKAAAGATKGSGMALAGIIIGVVALVGNVAVVSVVLSHRGTPAVTSSTSVFGGDPTAADAALARSEALPASAFPSGFTSPGGSSASSSGGFYGGYSDGQVRTLATCLGRSTAHVDTDPAEYTGHQYQDQIGDNLSENVEVYPSTVDAVTDVSALADPHAASCWLDANPGLGAAIAQGIGSGATVGTTTAGAVTVPAVGDRAAGLQVVIPMTVHGVSTTGYLDMVAIQRGRSEAILVVTGASEPGTSQLVANLAPAAAAHLTS